MNIKTKLAGLAVALLTVSGASYAAAPANSTITNTASLTYTNGVAGTATVNASVDVSISLVATAPTLSAPVANTALEGASSTFTYTITNVSNGPDTYNLSGPHVLAGVTGTDTTGFTEGGSAVTSVTLGATAISGIAGATLTVPDDGNSADSSVNGLEVGDTVVINGDTYTINAISEAGPTTITLNVAVPGTVTVGMNVAEQQTITAVIANVGTLTASPTPGTVTTTVTATSATDPGQVATNDAVTNVNPAPASPLPTVAFTKYVRNVTTDAAGTGTGVTSVSFDSDGAGPYNFYTATAGSVPAASGDTLEYLIRTTVTNTDTNPASITGASISDSVPVFTDYQAGSTRMATVVQGDVGADSALLAGMSINTPAAAAGTLTVPASSNVDVDVTFVVVVQ